MSICDKNSVLNKYALFTKIFMLDISRSKSFYCVHDQQELSISWLKVM